ncbi:(deoxy)nucleoside triphosphate pyrophosphohydrolase [Georgenia satyanarayanai]|uniref:(deoxy)nucleoside triphosphate pyrophosphohydrolase n=1 Tax=Georgenia satyanarayanai TaxID=860221 RepID=UPI001D00F7AD|nr:(deoxy)nucleoside triphosphate pyrophosphohydrolase [Georgenia satyanarayanai]
MPTHPRPTPSPADSRVTDAAAPAWPGRLVVAAAILDDVARPAHLLAARRSGPAELAGRWELPGGKVEPGEDPVDALHRELGEELDVRVSLGALVTGPLAGDWPITPTLRLRVWRAGVRSGTPRPLLDHDELRWVGADGWAGLPWLPADLPVVAALGLRG